MEPTDTATDHKAQVEAQLRVNKFRFGMLIHLAQGVLCWAMFLTMGVISMAYVAAFSNFVVGFVGRFGYLVRRPNSPKRDFKLNDNQFLIAAGFAILMALAGWYNWSTRQT